MITFLIFFYIECCLSISLSIYLYTYIQRIMQRTFFFFFRRTEKEIRNETQAIDALHSSSICISISICIIIQLLHQSNSSRKNDETTRIGCVTLLASFVLGAHQLGQTECELCEMEEKSSLANFLELFSFSPLSLY